MVLAGDENAPGRAIDNRMVGAAVAERELVRRVPGGEGEKLVPETDSEDRHAADQLSHHGDLVDERFGIAGAVGEQHAVELAQLVGFHGVREHGDRRTRAGQPSKYRAFAAVVDDGDARPSGVGVDVRFGSRHCRRKRAARHQRVRTCNRGRLFDGASAGDGHASQRPGLAQLEHERAGVDAAERDDPALVQPVRPAGPACLTHQHGARMRPGGFGAALRDPVVADHRGREADELLSKARVGDDLLVAGHRGGEDRFADRESVGGDRLAAEDGAVFEREEAGHRRLSRR